MRDKSFFPVVTILVFLLSFMTIIAVTKSASVETKIVYRDRPITRNMTQVQVLKEFHLGTDMKGRNQFTDSGCNQTSCVYEYLGGKKPYRWHLVLVTEKPASKVPTQPELSRVMEN